MICNNLLSTGLDLSTEYSHMYEVLRKLVTVAL
jgi:hypothetical protein